MTTSGAGPTSSEMLRVSGVGKCFLPKAGRRTYTLRVLSDVSFVARPGEFVTIIGPSGCGKSTLLRCIAGLVDYDEGQIVIDGTEVDRPSPECSMVFQDAALLPWRSVLHNVEYGLKLRGGLRREQQRVRSTEALDLVGLGEFSSYYPQEISGGMKQRVNLARALAVHPRLLLMDEPFGALDAITRETLQNELQRIVGSSRRTTIFVTHDVDEAVFLGDRVIVMGVNPGRIINIVDVPYERPRERAVLGSYEVQNIAGELRKMLADASAVKEQKQETAASPTHQREEDKTDN